MRERSPAAQPAAVRWRFISRLRTVCNFRQASKELPLGLALDRCDVNYALTAKIKSAYRRRRRFGERLQMKNRPKVH